MAKRERLTNEEIGAVVDCLNERLAGGSEDLADALGLDIEAAEKTFELAFSAMQKLQRRITK